MKTFDNSSTGQTKLSSKTLNLKPIKTKATDGSKSDATRLLDNFEHLENAQHWHGLKRDGMIEAERRIEGKLTTRDRSYYLTLGQRYQTVCLR